MRIRQLLFGLVVLLVMVSIESKGANAEPLNGMDSALNAINQAENAGVDTSNLVYRLDLAIKMSREPEFADSQNCSGNCLRDATNEFASIKNEAEQLVQEVQAQAGINIAQVAYYIMLATGIALLITFAYEVYKLSKLNKMLQSGIRNTQDQICSRS